MRYRNATKSELLQTSVLSTAGHRAECSCGWRGKVKRLLNDARAEGQAHFRETLGARWTE